MAFDFSSAHLKPGKTVPLVLNMLPGEPVVQIEHLGESNKSFFNDLIARANAKATVVPSKLTAKALKEARAKNREMIAKHAVRDLVATHDDGRKATKEDIPEFIAALPDDVIDLIREFASNPENFRDQTIEADPADIAEK